MVIREMREDDRAALRVVYRESRAQAFNWLAPELLQTADFDSDTNGEAVLVAEQAGRVVGFVALWLPDNFIHHLFVVPECQNQGYGSALLAAGLNIMGRPASLKCLSRNVRALDFYLARGWQVRSVGSTGFGEYQLMELA